MKKLIFCVVIMSFVLLFTSQCFGYIVFTEFFDGPSLPADWYFDHDGQWSIENGTLSQSKLYTNAHADCEAGDLNWVDYAMQMNFKYSQFGTGNMEAGVIVRGTWNEGGVVVRTSWRGYWNLELLRPQMQELHIPLNQNLTTGQWYSMKTLIEGDYLKVWVNDILYDIGDISPESTPIPSHGFIGLWANNAHVNFDNVYVDNLQAEPAPTPAPVPEPGTLGLLGLGIASIFGYRRKLRKRTN